ncbi:clostripain-related cysteine peptidase [Archangium sp.]|uniref:clostripain-related cysteine peptidase n=1 Tax=Archangium sp. TaxID=1872627 RepID=UPI002EDA12E9
MTFGWKGAVYALALALSLSLVACDEETDGGGEDGGVPSVPPTGTPQPHPTTGQSWTVLVYMVADNNLEPFALQDIVEMAQVGSGPNVNIVVQVDRAEGYSSDPLGSMPNWTTTRRMRVMPQAIENLGDLGEVNMGSPQTLSNFIEWGVKSYPADRYALVFWDHGGAWPGFGGDDSTQEQDVLSIAELKSGIQAGMQAAALKQFALIGYDACLMSTVEVALAMKPFGEYLLASEELEPGHGWDYQSLRVLRQDPSSSPLVLGKELIRGFQAQAVAEKTSENITLALTDLHALGDLEKAMEALASVYPIAGDAALATAFGRARTSALEFGKMPDPSRSLHMADLGHLADQLGALAPSAAQARTSIQAALAKAVVAKTSGPQTAMSTGLSIYFPSAAAYYKPDYAALGEMASWRGLLTRLLQGGTGAAPTFVGEVADISVDDSDNIVLRGALTRGSAERITASRFYYGYSDSSGTLVLLGDMPASVEGTSASAYVEASWAYSSLVLRQGTKSGYAYLNLDAAVGGKIVATMPFLYFESPSAEGQFAVRVLVLQNESLVQDSYYLQSEGGFGELYPLADSLLYPLVQVVDGEGNTSFDVIATGGFDATQPIALDFEPLASGTQAFGMLTIEDQTGQGDSAYNVWAVP